VRRFGPEQAAVREETVGRPPHFRVFHGELIGTGGIEEDGIRGVQVESEYVGVANLGRRKQIGPRRPEARSRPRWRRPRERGSPTSRGHR
jgi:hypothetical protein